MTDDLRASLDRFANGTYTEADVATLRRALQAGKITVATGERAVAVGGDMTDAIIITGDGNVVCVYKGGEAEAIKQAFHWTLEDLSKYEQCYLEQVREECGELRTEGVYPVTAPLKDVFVMLEAMRTPPSGIETDVVVPPGYVERNDKARAERAALGYENHPGEERQVTIRGKAPTVIPLSKALQEQQHLVILGDPGSGKTTLLQFVALCFATEGLAQEKLGLTENRVPIRVALRGYDGKGMLGELLVEATKEVGQFKSASEAESLEIARALLKRWLSERRVILLLDGLDEVPGPQRAAVAEAIARFSRSDEGRSCRIVVTSRVAGYRETGHIGAAFSCYTIRPFASAEDALPFVSGWLKAMVAALPQKEAEVQAHALLEKLERRRDRSVIANPLYLRLAVASYVRRDQIPRGRVELYNYYINEVLIGREKKRERDIPWSRRQLGEALESMAWALQIGEGRTIGELAEIIEREVQGIENGEKLISYLRERLGLLISYGYERGEVIAFRHATFREFFVARRLERAWKVDQEQTWKFLQPRLHHPDWKEPVLFLSAMLESEEATNLVERILDAKSPYESELHRDLLLAGECLESGAKIEPELRRMIIDKLLQLYFEQGGRDEARVRYARPAVNRLIIQPIESILSSLADNEHAYLTDLLLTIAEGKELEPLGRIVITSLVLVGRDLARWCIGVPLVFWDLVKELVIHPLLSRFKEQNELSDLPQPFREDVPSRTVRALKDFWYVATYPVRIPLNVRSRREGIRNSRRRIAIRLIGDLRIRTPGVTSALLSALEVLALRDVAAEALGKVGPGAPEVVRTLIDVQWSHRQVRGWDQTVESVIEAIGLLGQRHPEVVNVLLDLVKSPDADQADIRYTATQALCKAAETNVRAMEFVLEVWREIHRAQNDAAVWYALDEGIREGLRDGRKLFRSASPEVVRYLLDLLWNCDSCEAYFTPMPAAEFLGTVVGDAPLVQCKVVEESGRIHYHTVDLTEELFNLLQRASYRVADFALRTLSIWGMNRPDLAVRLIQTIREADAQMLAIALESRLEFNLVTHQALEKQRKDTPPLDQSTVEWWQEHIARLRSPNKATRDVELTRWLMLAYNARLDEYDLRYLPETIERTKCITFHKAYKTMCYKIKGTSEDELSRKPPPDLDPHVVTALACFRGWKSGALPCPTTKTTIEKALREEILEGTNFAVSILRSRDKRSVEILSSIVEGKIAEFFGSSLREATENLGEAPEQKRPFWYDRRKPYLEGRIAAAYALAELTADYPEAQEVLVSNLNLQSWGRGEFEETKFQEHVILALGSVKSANRDLVAALLDIVIYHDEKVYWAGESALSRLRNPAPEAVELLCDTYESLGPERHRVKSHVLETLSTAESFTPRIVNLFLGALKDRDIEARNAAAEGLGNIKKADPRVIKALLAALRHTAATARALGNLAGWVGTTARDLRLLRKIAKGLRRAFHKPDRRSQFWLPEDVRDIAYEALARVVGKITELEAKASPAHLPLLGSGESSPIAQRSSRIGIALSVLVSAVLGLASNVVAAYLQERYNLITDSLRFSVVLAVFVVSLVVGTMMALRANELH